MNEDKLIKIDFEVSSGYPAGKKFIISVQFVEMLFFHYQSILLNVLVRI